MYTVYFQVTFLLNNKVIKKTFLKADNGDDVGTMLSHNLPRENVVVKSIAAGSTANDVKTVMDPSTPIQVLLDFATNIISVELMDVEVSKADVEPGASDVFNILMAAQKSYTQMPKEREVRNSKDKLFNSVLQFLQKKGVGFTPMQVETTGKYICTTLTETLWFLDPHWEKFSVRSIECPEFEEFRGFNNWKKMKIKEPIVTSDGLHDVASKMVTMISSGFFLNQKFGKVKCMLESLVEAMRKYGDFLNKQAKHSATQKKLTEPVRSLSDNNILRDIILGTDDNKQYTLVDESLRNLKDFEPLFLFDYEPEDQYDRKKWLDKMTLPYPVKFYSHKFGNYMGNHSFVWKSPTDIEDTRRSTGDLDAITAIKHDLPKFSTRTMRKSFFEKYAHVGAKPAILRHMYRFLTDDKTAPENGNEAEVDERLSGFMLRADSTDLLYDLRKNNGRPKDPELDPFWDALEKHLDRISVVHERRHGEHMYMPVDISLESLIDTIKQDLPKDSRVPSPSWLAFNFWPTNPYIKSAMSYTGRFRVKYAVQQRMTRARHPDSDFAFTQYMLMKELAVSVRENSLFICLDDKSGVPIGEPGKPVSTGVRAHNKSLVLSGAKLSALDHDFHIHGAVPSVMFKVDIPEHCSDSFYKGSVHVTVKEKVFTPSSPMRHATECMKILRQENSEDSLSLNKPILFVYTDGGPDHRSDYWSVQLSYI